MKSRLLALLLALLPACAAVSSLEDTLVLDTSPTVGATTALLAGSLPVGRPVHVGDENLLEHGLYGLSRNLGSSYLVTIDPTLDERMRVAVLIHEWAHLLVWSEGHAEVGHGPLWGDAYRRVFQAWVGEDGED